MKKLLLVLLATLAVGGSLQAQSYDGAKIIASAEEEYGTYKAPGSDDPRVREYCTTTLNNDDTYLQDGWCSSFVAFILKENGYKFSSDNTDFAWMNVAHRVSEQDVKPGDIAMLPGHIAFYIGQKTNKEGDKVVGLLGGNQDYQVCQMWIPARDIQYYAEAEVATPDWKPSKFIPTGAAQGSINVLDDSVTWMTHSSSANRGTKSGHPF